MGLYEVQVLDSYGNRTYPDGQAAALYGAYPPLVNASRPPGQWQTYDILFRGPRFDGAGKLLRPARTTVLHNGVLVQDGREQPGPTAHKARPPYKAHADKATARPPGPRASRALSQHLDTRAGRAGAATTEGVMSEEYDVCVVGSGAGGGMAAKVLAEGGARVVLLEAGPMWDAAKDGAMFAWSYSSPRRGAGSRRKPFGEFDGCLGGWDLEGEPYTVAEGQKFLWWRARMLGGRTNHWGRISLRFGPWDFKGRSRDGLGDDWPISYDDIKPYYDKLDQLVGLFGSSEGLENEPDGIFQPPPAPRAYERVIKKACDGLKITCIPSRLSVLTRPLGGRPACHYCGQCGRGCATASNFSTPSVLLPPALKTGRLKILTGAMAREVLTNDEGLATAVSYVNTATGREEQVKAKVVVLAASACETARLLLNSKAPRHPDGLANSSGSGRPLPHRHHRHQRAGPHPQAEGLPPFNEDGAGGMHVYMPWWLYDSKLDFARGYHLEPWGGRDMPGYGFMGGIHKLNGGGYGKKLKDDYRRLWGSVVGFSGRGEMLPNRDCYCEIDPTVGGPVGIPGPPLPLEVVGAGAGPGQAHDRDVRRDHRGDGRAGAGQAARPRTRVRLEAWRRDHPRGRHHAHGHEPAHLGRQPSGARPMTARTCSWRTADRSSATPTRT
jgi:choline dehydrogenase-like flavoprotein